MTDLHARIGAALDREQALSWLLENWLPLILSLITAGGLAFIVLGLAHFIADAGASDD